MQFVLLGVGLFLIIISADILLDSSSKIARSYGVSTFMIGITVIAFGTSAPELVVGIVSGIQQTNALTLGNVIGSGMSNLALIIGISGLLMPLQVKKSVFKREFPILLMNEIVLAAMLLWDGELSRPESIILLGAFALFLRVISSEVREPIPVGSVANKSERNGKNENRDENRGLLKLWGYAVLSLLGLFWGGKMTVENSSSIAQSFGLGETLIGLTVVAIATTMPELITSIVAVRKKEPDIVLGNCLGSNIFNLLLVLGVSSFITPIFAEKGIVFDLGTLVVLTVFVFLVAVKRRKLGRAMGAFLITFYIAYLTIKVISVLD